MKKFISIEDLKNKGVPVKMLDGHIIEFCDYADEADNLILPLQDFPEITGKIQED